MKHFVHHLKTICINFGVRISQVPLKTLPNLYPKGLLVWSGVIYKVQLSFDHVIWIVHLLFPHTLNAQYHTIPETIEITIRIGIFIGFHIIRNFIAILLFPCFHWIGIIVLIRFDRLTNTDGIILRFDLEIAIKKIMIYI